MKKERIVDHMARIACAPPALKEAMIEITQRICDLGDEHQADPKTMATLLSAAMGGLALATIRGRPMSEQAIDSFTHFCGEAINISVAQARINAGAVPASH